MPRQRLKGPLPPDDLGDLVLADDPLVAIRSSVEQAHVAGRFLHVDDLDRFALVVEDVANPDIIGPGVGQGACHLGAGLAARPRPRLGQATPHGNGRVPEVLAGLHLPFGAEEPAEDLLGCRGPSGYLWTVIGATVDPVADPVLAAGALPGRLAQSATIPAKPLA